MSKTEKPPRYEAPLDTKVTLSPKWRIRGESGRAVLYLWDDQAAEFTFLPPVFGIILALCDGSRTLGMVAANLAYIDDDLEASTALGLVRKALGTVEIDQQGNPRLHKCGNGTLPAGHRTYRPAEFIRLRDKPCYPNRLSVPLALLYMPSNRCETDCVYCYSERKPISPENELSIERWLELLDEAEALGIDMVSFSGGDPLTYGHLDQILERICRGDTKFTIPTKGYVSPRRAARWVEIGMASSAVKVQISIDGPDAATADYMTRSPGFYQRAVESIRNLVACDIIVRTNTVLTPHNVRTAPDLVRQLHDLGVSEAGFTNYSRTYYRHDDAMFLSPEQVEWAKNELLEFKRRSRWEDLNCNVEVIDYGALSVEERRRDWPGRSGCSGGTCSMTICPDGSVTLCEQAPIQPPFVVGNVRTSSLMEVWNSDELLGEVYPPVEKFVGTACHTCEEFRECHDSQGRCFRDSYFVFGNAYAPPPTCPLAETGLRVQ